MVYSIGTCLIAGLKGLRLWSGGPHPEEECVQKKASYCQSCKTFFSPSLTQKHLCHLQGTMVSYETFYGRKLRIFVMAIVSVIGKLFQSSMTNSLAVNRGHKKFYNIGPGAGKH